MITRIGSRALAAALVVALPHFAAAQEPEDTPAERVAGTLAWGKLGGLGATFISIKGERPTFRGRDDPYTQRQYGLQARIGSSAGTRTAAGAVEGYEAWGVALFSEPESPAAAVVPGSFSARLGAAWTPRVFNANVPFGLALVLRLGVEAGLGGSTTWSHSWSGAPLIGARLLLGSGPVGFELGYALLPVGLSDDATGFSAVSVEHRGELSAAFGALGVGACVRFVTHDAGSVGRFVDNQVGVFVEWRP